MSPPRTLEVALRLESVHDLFRTPGTSPLSPHFGAHSTQPALQYIADEIDADSSYRHVRAAFDIPADEVVTQTDEDIRAGIRRWAEASVHGLSREADATRRRGRRFLLVGVVAFAFLIAASEIVGAIDDDLASTLSRGLEVAAWVVLWFPLDSLVFALWELRLDRRTARMVADMDVTITRR